MNDPIQTITVEPERFHCGLWGYAEGDISASYSAQAFGEKRQVRKPFEHAGRIYIAMCVGDGLHGGKARAYPIFDASYADDILAEADEVDRKDGYTGQVFKFRRNDCVLGLQTDFQQRPYREDEIIDLARRMYAYGGYFASQAESYHHLIAKWVDQYDSSEHRRAFLSELADGTLPETQTDMRQFIENAPAPAFNQLTLF